MQIKIEDLIRIVGASTFHRAGMHKFEIIHARTTKFYCDKLTVRSACAGKCDQCLLRVKEAVEWMQTKAGDERSKQYKSPYQLFIYLLKLNAEKAIEQAQKKPELKPEMAFGERTDRDVLDIFLGTL